MLYTLFIIRNLLFIAQSIRFMITQGGMLQMCCKASGKLISIFFSLSNFENVHHGNSLYCIESAI